MPDIFLSYATPDRPRASVLAAALSAEGWDVWWDRDIDHGDDYRRRIQEAIDSAKCVVVLWTKAALASDWVVDEAETGKQRGVLIPVFAESVTPPLGFRALQAADLTAWQGDIKDESYAKFRRALVKRIGEPTRSIAPPDSPVPLPNVSPPPRFRRTSASVIAFLLIGALGTAGAGYVIVHSWNAKDPGKPETVRPALTTLSTLRYSLDDFWCATADTTGNPIIARAHAHDTAAFRVDTRDHLLLDRSGKPVSVASASGLSSLHDRRLLVIHGTVSSAASAEDLIERPNASASYHVLITRDGAIKQLVPFDKAAWHVGPASWHGLRGLNGYSLGIALENRLSLHHDNGVWTAEAGGASLPDSEVVVSDSAPNRGWQKYSAAQLRTLAGVACAIRRAYPSIETVVGHAELDNPTPKIDPGPAFPMDGIRLRLFAGSANRGESRGPANPGATSATPTQSGMPNVSSAGSPGTQTPPVAESLATGAAHLVSNRTLIWDPESRLTWAENIYEFGVTKDLFSRSHQQLTTPTKDLDSIAARATALHLGKVGGWRIATDADIKTLRRFDGSVVFQAFAHRKIATGATNVVGIYVAHDGGIATWGYQHANFLTGPDVQFGAYALNEYGVWLVAGPMDQPFEKVEGQNVFSRPERTTEMTFEPRSTAVLEKSGSSIRRLPTDDSEASVGSIGQGETRSVFFYSLAALPAGAMVRAELVLEPIVSSGRGEVTFSLYKTDATLRPTESGDWEPTLLGSGDLNTVSWDGRADSRPTLPQHLMRNATTQRGWLGVHARYTGNGNIKFKPPRLIVTYIKQADLLVSR